MKTMMHDFSGTVRKSSEIMTIHTTLYDLSAALSAEVGPDEEDVLTAAVMHLLKAAPGKWVLGSIGTDMCCSAYLFSN
jgi:hypothetical protein